MVQAGRLRPGADGRADAGDGWPGRHPRDPPAAARARELPILAMTANAFDEERQRCLEAGMDDHVAKPVVADQLFNDAVRVAQSGERTTLKAAHGEFASDSLISLPRAGLQRPRVHRVEPGKDAQLLRPTAAPAGASPSTARPRCTAAWSASPCRCSSRGRSGSSWFRSSRPWRGQGLAFFERQVVPD